MMEPARIESDSLYDDAALCLTLPISWKTLATARQSGALRFTRKGKRNFYFGRWVIEWLESESSSTGLDHTERELVSA